MEIQKIDVKLQDFSEKKKNFSCKTRQDVLMLTMVHRFACKKVEMAHDIVQIEVSKTEQKRAGLMNKFINLSLFLT